MVAEKKRLSVADGTEFAELVEGFLAKHQKVGKCIFGELALNDRDFVRKVRTGRDFRLSTVAKALRFMERYAEAAR